MAYTKTTWVDRVVQYPNRYDKTGETLTQVTLTASPGTITTAGTALNATALNNLEKQYDESVIYFNSRTVPAGGMIYAYNNLGGF